VKTGIRQAVSVFIFCLVILWSGCSLETFKEFSVSSVSIAENGEIGTGGQAIEILFTKDVDPLSVEDTLRVETALFSEVSITKSVSGNSVLMTPDQDWQPHTRFWLIVEKDIQDVYGKNMDENFYHPFQSTAEILPVSTLLVSPKVENGIVGSSVDEIVLSFNRDVDLSSVEKAFFISPETQGYFEWASNRECTYHLTEDFLKNSLYTIRITDIARDKSGYSITPFSCSFEYFPNEPLSIVSAVQADGALIYNPDDQDTYNMEGDAILVSYDGAEKNSVFRFDFSKEMDATSFRDSIRVAPFTEWHEQWVDARTVWIIFDEDLDLDGYYEISLNRSISDNDGLNLMYDYIIDIHIDGVYSRFIEFYAGGFSDLAVAVGDVELWSGGSKIDGAVEDVVLEESTEGSVMTIDYDEGLILSPEAIEVRLKLPLRFTNPSYIPAIDEESLQDSIHLKYIFGGDVFIGGIYVFDWTGTNECIVELRDMGSGYVYGFSIRGGASGVIDDQKNYLRKDIEYFFRVSLVSGL